MPKPNLAVFIWRYATGQHLDGKARTDATLLRRGTIPPHHVNWWTGKPILHRIAWRWGMVLVPSGWGLGIAYAPVWEVNTGLVATLAILPYVLHHAVLRFLALLPSVRVVSIVEHTIPSYYVNTDLDDVVISEDNDGGLAELGDFPSMNMSDMVEASKPRRTRKDR